MNKIIPWLVTGGAVLVLAVFVFASFQSHTQDVSPSSKTIVAQKSSSSSIDKVIVPRLVDENSSLTSDSPYKPYDPKDYDKYFTCSFGPFEFSYPDVGQLSERLNKKYYMPTTTTALHNWICDNILREGGNTMLGVIEGTTTLPLYRNNFADTPASGYYVWDDKNNQWLIYSDYPNRIVAQTFPGKKIIYGDRVVGYYSQLPSYEEPWDVIVFERNGYYLIYSPYVLDHPFSGAIRSSMKYSN